MLGDQRCGQETGFTVFISVKDVQFHEPTGGSGCLMNVSESGIAGLSRMHKDPEMIEKGIRKGLGKGTGSCSKGTVFCSDFVQKRHQKRDQKAIRKELRNDQQFKEIIQNQI